MYDLFEIIIAKHASCAIFFFFSVFVVRELCKLNLFAIGGV